MAGQTSACVSVRKSEQSHQREKERASRTAFCGGHPIIVAGDVLSLETRQRTTQENVRQALLVTRPLPRQRERERDEAHKRTQESRKGRQKKKEMPITAPLSTAGRREEPRKRRESDGEMAEEVGKDAVAMRTFDGPLV